MAPMRVAPDGGKTAEREAVGLWGEEFVYQALRAAAEPGKISRKISCKIPVHMV